MTRHTLSATLRNLTGRKVKKLRLQGLIPANVFGKTTPTLNIQLPAKEFLKVYKEVGESTLVYLQVEKEKETRPVLVSEVTRDPVTSQLLHVSFHQVDLKAKVTAPVAIRLTGEAPAESEGLGILVQQLDEVEIEALPTDMPENIIVDISGLTEVGSQITVSNLQLDSKLVIKSDLSAIIVKIEALAKEEVKEAPAEAGEANAPAPAEPAPAAEPKVETHE